MSQPNQSIVTGPFLVETLLRHGRVAPVEVTVVKGGSSRGLSRIVKRAESASVPLRWVSRDGMRELTCEEGHEVAATLGEHKVLTSSALLAEAPEPAFLLALEGIENPHNVGAILRTAWAAGVDGVVLVGHARSLPRDVLARSSAGASECLPLVFAQDFLATLRLLGDAGITCVAADPASKQDLFEADLPERLALVVGGEHRGLSRSVLDTCEVRVRLPMGKAVQSLPAATSAAVMLYEVVRRRTASH